KYFWRDAYRRRRSPRDMATPPFSFDQKNVGAARSFSLCRSTLTENIFGVTHTEGGGRPTTWRRRPFPLGL
ncbi:MAG: hypothetical protein IJ668_05490, partial [Selenomonadaceae bacterium]|nr:hypothetical protein [Selenomonadaceae bacterium]